MSHIRPLSMSRTVAPANDIATISALISLFSAFVSLLGQISSVFGVSFDFLTKDGAQS